MTESTKRKKSILLVDDEPAILELYQLMFKSSSETWDVYTARSGAEAMALMEQTACEVVVSDMRMPGMSGAQLLNQIMQRYPKTARMILSGYADQEAVAKCVGAAHQYLMKPCDMATLRATLARVCALDVFLQNDHLKSLVSRMEVLPSMPSLYFRVLEELQSPTSSIDRIGELVGMDIGMTAKMLQLVNSAFFGVRRQISSPSEAVQLLGVGTVRALVLIIHVFACYDRAHLMDFSFERLWNHSLTTGSFARKIAESENADRPMVDEAFVAGLLHDLGTLMLVGNLAKDFRLAVAEAKAKNTPVWMAEQSVFGATHADVGAYLLGLWGLPVPIVEAVALHHHPSRNISRVFSPLTAVHAANVIEHNHFGETQSPVPSTADGEYLKSLRLDHRLQHWQSVIVEMIEQQQAA